MKKIIDFCNKTRGSYWWLILAITSVVVPIIAVPYTIFSTEIAVYPVQKIFSGSGFSQSNFLWMSLIDCSLLYMIVLSKTFFRIWKRCIFLADPATEFHGWSMVIMRFNSEKEMYFFKYFPLGSKGYWLEAIG